MGGGGFRGAAIGGGGGFRGGAVGIGGGGFRSAAIGGGGFRSAAIRTGGFRTAAVGPGAFRGSFAAAPFRGGFNQGFRHHRRFPIAAAAVGFGLGLGWPYGYYDYGYPYYDDVAYNDYYGDSGCYLVRRPVLTSFGWRVRRVQVCDWG
jgi:hypothetical protein